MIDKEITQIEKDIKDLKLQPTTADIRQSIQEINLETQATKDFT